MNIVAVLRLLIGRTMLVSHVYELVRDQEVTIMLRSRSSHSEAINIEDGRGNSEHGYELENETNIRISSESDCSLSLYISGQYTYH